MNCIEIKGITKDFKNTRALNNVNLTLRKIRFMGCWEETEPENQHF